MDPGSAPPTRLVRNDECFSSHEVDERRPCLAISGGSSFRAALIDLDGTVLAESAAAGPVLDDHLGHSQVAAEGWWKLLIETAGDLARQEPDLFAKIEAIATCGVTRTQVFLGADGRELRPALTWKDSRSAAAAAGLLERLGPHPETGRINAFHPLARLAWLTEAEPESARRLTRCWSPRTIAIRN